MTLDSMPVFSMGIKKESSKKKQESPIDQLKREKDEMIELKRKLMNRQKEVITSQLKQIEQTHQTSVVNENSQSKEKGQNTQNVMVDECVLPIINQNKEVIQQFSLSPVHPPPPAQPTPPRSNSVINFDHDDDEISQKSQKNDKPEEVNPMARSKPKSEHNIHIPPKPTPNFGEMMNLH